eukprot:TRINITY_DN19136_c0_g1_i1.p3 TRINITY_DN19136_c0_g1~~TRINITY_DN19136_c0_g1_i1.p3  ORF type:complete len:117 (-),score=15.99 TRINITY_DN19136_c0_g1_i1:345-665(-)
MGKHNGRVRMSKDGLGKALANKNKSRGGGDKVANIPQVDQQQINYQSVIERNDLDELLAMADLAGRDFVADRSRITVISTGAPVDPQQMQGQKQKKKLLISDLRMN